MSVSNKTNYNKNKKYWKIIIITIVIIIIIIIIIITCQLPHIFNIACHDFQCDIFGKAYLKIPLN